METPTIREKLIFQGKKLLGRVLCTLMRVFPLQRKVVFSNFSGKRYDDNPRYVSEALHKAAPEIHQVWLKHSGYEFDTPDYIDVCPWPSVRMFYELGTAAVWVDSHSKPIYVWKRRHQYYIETWHGGLGMKRIEEDAADLLAYDYLETSRHNVSLADIFISNSTWLTDIYRSAFKYKGEIAEIGYPKDDIFFQNKHIDFATKVRKKLGLENNRKIFLYAPTFREKYGLEKWLTLDLEKVFFSLNDNTQNSWIVLVKFHPTMINNNIVLGPNIINVTTYSEMQELLFAADIFVTDYSSCIFDFCLTKKPAFLYASDYTEYTTVERKLYFTPDELPFSFSETTDELIDNIVYFDYENYERKIETFTKKVGLIANENASKKVSEIIINRMMKQK